MFKKNPLYFSFIPVVLTLLLSNHIPYINSSWSVITAFVCFKNSFLLSLNKTLSRVLGTFLGAILGVVFITFFNNNAVLFSILILIIGTCCIYFNNKTEHGFGWIYFTVTFFATCKTFEIYPNSNLEEYIISRLSSVALGAVITLAFSLLIEFILNKRKFYKSIKEVARFNMNNVFDDYFTSFDLHIFIYSFEAGLALFMVSFIHFGTQENLIFHTIISILFLSNIPYKENLNSNRKLFVQKLLVRLLAAVIGSIISVGLLFVISRCPSFYYPFLALAILFASFLQINESTSYFGLQIGLLFIMLLVPMPKEYLSLHNALLRLEGIITASVAIISSIILVSSFKFIYKKTYQKEI